MDSIDIISLLASDNYIIFNKEIAKEYGIEVAIIIGELASEYKYYQKNNQLIEEYFYSTIENVENNTTLSRYQQDKALNKLKELNLIDVKVKGIPPKRYVKFNLQIFTNQFVKNLQIKMQKTNKLNCKKLTTNNNNINNNNNNNKYNSASINEKGTQKGTNCPIDIRDKRLDIRDKIIDNNIYNYIQKKLGRVLSPIECEIITKWEIYSKEDIKECIDKAFEMNKYSIQYINTMLYNKKNKPKEVIKNTSNDVLPSWFDKEEDIEEEPLSEEEQKEMDQLMSKYQD